MILSKNNETKTKVKGCIALAMLLVLTMVALYTALIGWQLFTWQDELVEAKMASGYSAEAAEAAEATEFRIAAQRVQLASSNAYANWLVRTPLSIKLPVSLLVIFSPVLFFMAVRTYNLKKRSKARIY